MSLSNRFHVYNKYLKSMSMGLCSAPYSTVLGIETSCDDTGCAVMNSNKKVLGESLISQNSVHVRYGGVNPIIARDLHRDNIEEAAAGAITKSQVNFDNIDAIAVTTKPGLLVSLQIGVKYANFLAKKYQKPLIPIHHMEAHALTARLCYEIPFPYLVLLISGGDCLIGVVRGVENFVLLGKTLDNAPGEILDKGARRMKLRNIPEYSQLAGGKAIELAAMKSTDHEMFKFTVPLIRSRNCNFSFSGLKESLYRKVIRKENEHRIGGGDIIPEIYNLSAAYQAAVAEHIMHRLERAIMFCERNNYFGPDNRNLVVSGGVACNNFIFKALQHLGKKVNYNVYRPPPQLCTDNGVMIAWNGLERLQAQLAHTVCKINLKDINPNAEFGQNLIKEVSQANIQTKFNKLKMYGLCLP